MEKEWDGLACPPMDDYAYNFDDASAYTTTSGGVYNLDPDVFFGKSCEEQQDCNKENPTIVRKQGKRKELKKVFEVNHVEKTVNRVKDPDVFFDESCQRDCNNKKMKKKPTIIRKQGKGKELKKEFEIMKPHMEADAYVEAVNFAEAEMEKDKLEATKRKLCESYEQINDSKKQRTIKLNEFQPPVPMSKPTIRKTKPTIRKPMPRIQKSKPAIQKPMPTIQKPKPKAKPKSRTTWGSRLAKTVEDICS